MSRVTMSRRGVLAASFAFAALGSPRGPALAQGDNAGLRARILDRFGPGGTARVRLDELAGADRLSGVVAVALGEEVLFQEAYGLADRERQVPNRTATRFNLASMNKMFTAVAILRLVEQGRLSVEDPVARHVSGLPPEFGPITIAHLLTHRSGLGSYFGSPLMARLAQDGRTVSDYMEAVRLDRPQFAPGERYAYSNNGYVLLGAVIERVTGEDYFQAVDRLVYQPANMRHTAHTMSDRLGPEDAKGYTKGCFARPPSQCTPQPAWTAAPLALRGTPAGGGYSNVPDLLRFSAALRGGRLVRPDTLDLMRRRHVDGMPPGGPIDGYGYGFGLLRVNGVETFGHNGGTPGATCQIDMVASERLTTIVLANVDPAQRTVSALVRQAVLA